MGKKKVASKASKAWEAAKVLALVATSALAGASGYRAAYNPNTAYDNAAQYIAEGLYIGLASCNPMVRILPQDKVIAKIKPKAAEAIAGHLYKNDGFSLLDPPSGSDGDDDGDEPTGE